MKQTKLFFVVLFHLVFFVAYSQSDSIKIKSDRRIIFSPGMIYQHQLMGEVGLIFGVQSGGGPCNPGIYNGPKAAVEFNLNPKQFFIAAKLSYDYDVMIVG